MTITLINSNDAELHALAHEVRILAGIVSKVANRDMEQRIQASGAHISGLQHGVLRLLSKHAYTSSELSRKMMLTPATLVPAVDALERHGLLQRGHDPSDRRRTPLLLTEQALELLKRMPLIDNDDTLANSLATMEQAHRQQLLLLLRELVTAMVDSPAHVQEISERVQQMLQCSSARSNTTTEQL